MQSPANQISCNFKADLMSTGNLQKRVGTLEDFIRTCPQTGGSHATRGKGSPVDKLKHVERNLFGKSRSDPLFTCLPPHRSAVAHAHMGLCPAPPLCFSAGVEKMVQKFVDAGSGGRAYSRDQGSCRARLVQLMASDVGLCPSPPLPFSKQVGEKVQRYLDVASGGATESHDRGDQLEVDLRRAGRATFLQKNRLRRVSMLSLAGRSAMPHVVPAC